MCQMKMMFVSTPPLLSYGCSVLYLVECVMFSTLPSGICDVRYFTYWNPRHVVLYLLESVMCCTLPSGICDVLYFT